MKSIIGLSVEAGQLRAVLSRGQEILWAGEEPWPTSGGRLETIKSLLLQAPAPRFRRPVVQACLGPTVAHVRLIRGLPPTSDPDLVRAMVQEGPRAFFLLEDHDFEITIPIQIEQGTAWVGALDRTALSDLAEGVSEAGLKFVLAAPAVSALMRAFKGDSAHWVDGEVTLTLRRSGKGIDALEQKTDDPGHPAPVPNQPVSALASLGEGGSVFGLAYGVTQVRRGDGLTVSPGKRPLTGGELTRRARAPLWIAVAGFLALTASPLAWAPAGRASEASLPPSLSSESVQTIHNQLTQANEVLRRAGQFEDGRSDLSHLLVRMAQLLPDSIFLVHLDIQGREGSAVLAGVSPEHAQVVLEAIPGVSSTGAGEGVAAHTERVRSLPHSRVRFQLTRGAAQAGNET